MPRLARSFILALGVVAGCTIVLRGSVREPVESCVSQDDGTPCRAAEFCLDETCVYSACGDAFVDATTGEQCDDGNLISGDGCEPGRCRLTCSRDEQCADGPSCTENQGCDVLTHTCRQRTPASGPSCSLGDGTNGTCRSGLCASASCGDGTVQEGEECDSSAEGCRPDCQWVCDESGGCSTTDLCTMPMHCDTTSHVCVGGTSPSCNDDDACTADSCDSQEGCLSMVIDGDGDGYAPGTCAPGSTFVGGDCDDTSADRHPNAPEMLNQLDDDCDMIVDEDPGVTCLRDSDLDGFGDPNVTQFMPACGGGWVGSRPRNDCHDGSSAVSPGITTYSPVPYCKTGTLTGTGSTGFGCSDSSTPFWDWNCDDNDTVEVGQTLNSCANASSCGGTYWATAVPACGTQGTLRNCAQSCVLVLCNCNNSDTPNVVQRCR